MGAKGFSNLSIKTKKYTKKTHGSLSNLGKHLLRMHKEKNSKIDNEKTQNNEVLIPMQCETLAQSLNKFLTDNELKTRNSATVQAFQVVFSCDKETFKDPELLEKWKVETMKFIQTDPKFKDNCLIAVFHKDEIQPHIQAVFVPRKGNKLAFNEMFGGAVVESSQKMSKLHDDYAKHYLKLGFDRGDGTHTNNLDYKQYMKSVNELNKPNPPLNPITEEQKVLGIVINKDQIIEDLKNQIKSYKKAGKKSYFYEAQNKKLKKVNRAKLAEINPKIRELEEENKQARKRNFELDQSFKLATEEAFANGYQKAIQTIDEENTKKAIPNTSLPETEKNALNDPLKHK
jgi:hypothetical protein